MGAVHGRSSAGRRTEHIAPRRAGFAAVAAGDPQPRAGEAEIGGARLRSGREGEGRLRTIHEDSITGNAGETLILPRALLAGPSHLRFARLRLPTGFAGRCETRKGRRFQAKVAPATPPFRSHSLRKLTT